MLKPRVSEYQVIKGGAFGMALLDAFPRIRRRDLAQRERQPVLLRVDFLHPTLHRLAVGDGRILERDTGRQRRDVHEAVHARLDLDEEAEIRVAGDGARERRAGSEALRQRLPRIGLELLHGKRNALALARELRDLNRDLLADGEDRSE